MKFVAPTDSRLYCGLAIPERSEATASADCQSVKQQSATLRYALRA